MTLVNLPYRTELAGGQAEDIGMVLADFDAILAVVNGDLRNDNIAAAAAISTTKLAITGTRDGTKFLRDDNVWAPNPAGIFTLAGDTVLAAPAANIDIQGLSGGRSLEIRAFLKSDRSSSEDDLGVRFNNDSGTNYDCNAIRFRTNTPAMDGGEAVAQTSGRLANFLVSPTGSVANRFAGVHLVLPNHVGTTDHKIMIATCAKSFTSAAGGPQVLLGIVSWKVIAAITRVTLLPVGGGSNFVTGSRCSFFTA